MEQSTKHFDKQFFRSMWKLTHSYWYSEEKWKARGLLAVIVCLTLFDVYIAVLINQWYNTFYNTLQQYRQSEFLHDISLFATLAFLHIAAGVYGLYLRQMLQIAWRKWMTNRYVNSWLARRTYYRMQLLGDSTDNPDQRISEDLNLFTSATLQLTLGLLKAIVTVGSFIVVLWRLSGILTLPLGSYQLTIPGYLVWAAVGYTIAGTWLTVKIGRPLIGLNYNQQRYEADFRFSLVRLRENSESIAFYRGENQERVHFTKRFLVVFDNFWQIMKKQKQLTWFTLSYFQFAIIFPTLVAAPRYFARKIELGGLIQISNAFGNVQESLSFIVNSYTDIAAWKAVVDRLLGFVRHMETVQAAATGKEKIEWRDGQAGLLAIKNLKLGLPSGRMILNNLDFQLKEGDALLVAGPSGAGKSTLLRSLAGLWPYGEGCILEPSGQTVLFLPQKSYLPLGTLRDVLLYPQPAGSVSEDGIKQIMAWCKLDGFINKLDQTEDWSRILSLGEQQRIAFARVLLQRPQWLFLDEATSALDEVTEKALYQLLQERLNKTTIVSVGHRDTLNNYHKQKLTLDGAGGWSLSVINRT
ncbi:abc transporter [Lucifera butyrica]|uniref:Abc transporter n=1 Tax=Lucifera butyrica TaxID=1351585 RepID=A0A498RB08_9FIRM|nr:ABC transporter ATP-binding protein/permease [Lucifera butyrica]VBB08664.1 abc transporter [Lucifera butyrica]